MKRLLAVALVAPALLAPVRFQQGNTDVLLMPSTAPTGSRGGAAVALPSPTVISVSPTRAPLPAFAVSSSGPIAQPGAPLRITATTALPNAIPTRVAPNGLTEAQAAICVRSLGLVADLAELSFKQGGSESLSRLAVAATLAQMQVAKGLWPALGPLKRTGVPLFAPNRAELKQALAYTETFCTNPNRPQSRSGTARPR